MNMAGAVTVNRNAIILVLFSFILLYAVYNYRSTNESTAKKKDVINLKDLLSASIDAAKRGGIKVYKVRESATLEQKSKGKTEEGANNPVTDGDMQSHVEMFNSIQKAFPNVAIVSEEKPTHKQNNANILSANTHSSEIKTIQLVDKMVSVDDIQVWIDPLDATQEYTENLRQYVTTMVCVAVKGIPTIGVIHKPFTNFTAWAWSGVGNSPTLKDVHKLKKDASTAESIRIIVSRSHKGPVVSVAEKAFGSKAKITDAGGAGFKVMEVLMGNQDVYVHKTLIKKWDICAGNAILNHFDGQLTNLKGEIIDYGPTTDYKNPGGLIASLENHKFYVENLKDLGNS